MYCVAKMRKDMTKKDLCKNIICETKEDIEKYLTLESARETKVNGLHESDDYYYSVSSFDGIDENGNSNYPENASMFTRS